MRNKNQTRTGDEAMESYSERYEKFAKDLWKRGRQATESGATRVVTRRQLENCKDKHGVTEFDAFNPDWDARIKVSVIDTEGPLSSNTLIVQDWNRIRQL